MRAYSVIAALAAGISLTATAASAATFLYAGSGTGGDGPVSAQASITTGVNSLSVALSSLIANPTAAGQEVSGIEIDLASTPGSATLGSQTGSLIDIAGGGAVTPEVGNPTHWGAGNSGSAVFLETAGSFAVGGKPIDLIIGPGPYTNANPSITGRNPQIQDTGNFVINLTGETNPTITGVKFLFGTGPDTTITGHAVVPEPGAWAMMLIGVFGAGAILRWKRAQRPSLA